MTVLDMEFVMEALAIVMPIGMDPNVPFPIVLEHLVMFHRFGKSL